MLFQISQNGTWHLPSGCHIKRERSHITIFLLKSLPNAFSFVGELRIFPFSILCSDDCRLCEFYCCGSRVCSNKIVLGFYWVSFIDSAVQVIEFMAPPPPSKKSKMASAFTHYVMLSPNSGVFPLSLGIQVVKSGEDSRLLYLGSCNGVSSFKIERWGFQREGNR